jgi:hypothetical protein
MSQEPNTTSDTNPQPRPPGEASAAGAPPRFSFAPKKKAEETPAVPVEQTPSAPASTNPPLKRPPPGTRLVAGNVAAARDEMPAPLTPVKPGATTTPFAKKSKEAPRANLGMRVALIVLLLATLGEGYVIFVMRDESTTENSQKPALLVNTGPSGKPLEVLNDGAPPPTPAYGFLVNFTPQVASGSEPRLFFETKTYRIGEAVAPEFGLKWTRIDDQNRELEFTDRQGRRYVKKF